MCLCVDRFSLRIGADLTHAAEWGLERHGVACLIESEWRDGYAMRVLVCPE